MPDPRTIKVDEDVWRRLQQDAVPFVDTPNTVLRRLLGLDADTNSLTSPAASEPRSDADRPAAGGAAPAPRSKARPRRSKERARRASSADLLPEIEYELPILAALDEAGGRAPTREVLDAVGKALDGRLTAVDRETTSSGTTRWQSRTQLVRLRLVRSGDMLSDSPRGLWEISDAGAARVAKVEGDR